MSSQSDLSEVKPRWRGVLHHGAALVALGAGAVLTLMAPGARAAVSAAVFSVALATMLGVSALYHRREWSPAADRWLMRADHAAIFVFIAGTYTPFALLGLEGEASRALLTTAWVGAGLGVLQALLFVQLPRVLTSLLYVGLGWAVVPYLGPLREGTGPVGLTLLAVGGVLYSVGALVYALRRPDPAPRVFGYHEVFHALVVLAVVCHFASVALLVRASAA